MSRAIITSNLTAGGFVDINKPLLTAVCFKYNKKIIGFGNYPMYVLDYENGVLLLYCNEDICRIRLMLEKASFTR